MANPRKPRQLILRSYNVGFGDCYMLSFEYPGFDRHILVDFGSTRLPKVGRQRNHMVAVARQIEQDCGGKLDAVVVSHRHKDHIGALPYLQRRLRCPIYATPFTSALVHHKLGRAGSSSHGAPAPRQGRA